MGSVQLLHNLAASRSPSGQQVTTVCHAPCIPTPSRDTPCSAPPVLVEREFEFPRVSVQDQPDSSCGEVRKLSTSSEMQRLFDAYSEFQKDAQMKDGRWSEEAVRRYEEYKKTWKRFRQTRQHK